MELAPKLNSFKPEEAYRTRTLNELNSLVEDLNKSKENLTQSIGFYLEKYKDILDPPRLCRALAMPDLNAMNMIRREKLLSKREHEEFRVENLLRQINSSLKNFSMSSEEGLSASRAINRDLNEIRTYLRMYLNIDIVKDYLLKNENGKIENSFDYIVDILNEGAIIARYKYKSDNLGEPEEKFVTYHPMKYRGRNLLGVHVEGDEKFSMYKRWGQSDDKLKPLDKKYEERIIRWGLCCMDAKLQGREHDKMHLLY